MKFLKTLTGAIVILIVALIFDAWSFLLISIICTAGISLVLYIPLSLAIGELVFIIFKWDKKEEKTLKTIEGAIKKDKEVNKGFLYKIDRRNEILNLVTYIGKARDANISTVKIIDNLREAGWKDADIEKSIEIVNKYGKTLFS